MTESRPKSNLAQIVSAICVTIGLFFGQNLCNRNQIEPVIQGAESQKETSSLEIRSIQKESSNVVDSASESISKINTKPFKYLDRVFELRNNEQYKLAVDLIDSIIGTGNIIKEESKILINTREEIVFALQRGFDIVEIDDDMELILVVKDGKFGLFDRGYEELLPIENEEIYNVHKNLIAYRKEDKVGFIDRIGNVLIKPTYDDVFDEYLPYTVIMKDELVGIVDSLGTEIFQPIYTDLEIIDEYVILDIKGKFGLHGLNGSEILPIKYDYLEFMSKNQLELIRNDKEYIFDIVSQKMIDLEDKKQQ